MSASRIGPHGRGVTKWRAGDWEGGPAEEARSPRLTHLDRDRALVEAAQVDPARFDALYRRYLAQVYSYAFYELGDHHDAEDATERDVRRGARRTSTGSRSARGPTDGEGASTFRVWLFQIARNEVADAPARPRPATRGGARRRGRRGRHGSTSSRRGRPPRGGERRLAGRRAAARRSSPRHGPALRRRDVAPPRSPACSAAPRARSGS